jgi:hypothetical protein
MSVRRDRLDRSGGGVMLYVKKEFVKEVITLEFSECKDVEILSCKVVCFNGESYTVIVCYRPEKSTEYNVALNEAIIKIVTSVNNPIFMFGDFNFGGISWSDQSYATASEREFVNMINDLYLQQIVTVPTRMGAILDLIFISDLDYVGQVTANPPLGNSDHDIIEYRLCLSSVNGDTHRSSRDRKRNYHRGDYSKMRKLLSSVKWETMLMDKNVIECWDIFCNIYNEVVKASIPMVRYGNKMKKIWMNRTTLKLISRKVTLWKKYRRNSSEENYREYVLARNAATRSVKQAKAEYESNLVARSKKNPKVVFKYVREKAKVKTGIPVLKDEDNVSVYTAEAKAKVLNQFFASVFTEEDCVFIPELPVRTVKKLDNIQINTDEVQKKLVELNPNKTPGVDGIHPRVLKEGYVYFACPLSRIFELSLKEGLVPPVWKDANVTPIHKGGAKDSASNYRPVSLTSVPCKIMESIVRDQVMDYLEVNELLVKSQHGFMPNRSCQSQLLESLNMCTDWVDKGHSVDIVYLDYRKAFDSVPHQRLLNKCRSYGLGEEVVIWLASYLGGRRQRVTLDGQYSEWVPVRSGVPQGSVLGPILFNLYTNDLDEWLTSIILKYADDAKIMATVDDIESCTVIQEDLQKVDSWSETWQMQLNPKKCKVMHIGQKNLQYEYTIKGEPLLCTSKEKDLGILVCDDLKVGQQCQKAANQANKMAGMLLRTFSTRNQDLLVKLYRSYIRPHLEYCVQVWSPYMVKDVLVLEKVQQRFTKKIDDMHEYSYEDRLALLDMTSLADRRRRGDMILVHKIFSGDAGVDLDTVFCISEESRTRGHQYKLQKNHCRLEIRRNFFSARVVTQWNELPEQVVNARTLQTFKHRYDKWRRDRDTQTSESFLYL